MRRTPALIGLLALAGCGGPSAEERRAAESAWSKRAEKRCEQSAALVASTRQAGTIEGLDRYARDVSGYLREGIADIGRIPVGEGAEERADAVSGQLRAAEPSLRALTEATRNGDRDAEISAAKALRARFGKLEPQLRTGGLKSCFTARQGQDLADRVLSPIWIQEFTELETRAMGRFDDVSRGDVSIAELPGRLRSFARTIDRVTPRFARLQPPSVVDVDEYLRILARVSKASSELAARIDARDVAGIRRTSRLLLRLGGESSAERSRLLAATNSTAAPEPPKTGEDSLES